jgi:large subunit ribosomal protein L14
MIKINSILKVIDNSGIKKVKCIKILGGYKKKCAKLGDLIVVTVKNIRSNNLKIKKKDIFRALVTRTKVRFVDLKTEISTVVKSSSL